MGQPSAPPVRSFSKLPAAIEAFVRAARASAAEPENDALREELEAVRLGLQQAVDLEVQDREYAVRFHHHQWHRRALRKLLEEPVVQSDDARYLGYLAALRAIGKELSVSWPPYGMDDAVHSAVPDYALQPEPPIVNAPKRRR